MNTTFNTWFHDYTSIKSQMKMYDAQFARGEMSVTEYAAVEKEYLRLKATNASPGLTLEVMS